VPSSHTLIVTAQDNGSSLILRPGETLQVVLGGTDGVLVVSDNVQGVAQIAQLGEGGKQAVVFLLMQADAGFIQHVKDPSQAAPIWVARRMRWASPPERVMAVRSRLR
jgi:hypothetical protein